MSRFVAPAFVWLCCSLFFGFAAAAAGPAEDSSVVIAPVGRSPDVENGTAYDRADIELGTTKQIAVPLDAEVVQAGSGTTIRLYTRKTLGFAGHPPEKMSIRTGRNNFGCASRLDGEVLVVGTFGEFGTKEGGAQMKLRVIVPQGIGVDKRLGLSGADSEVHKGSNEKSRDPKNGYWYGPTAPAEGWTKVETKPDGDRTLGK